MIRPILPTDNELAALRHLCRIVEMLREVDPSMPVSYVYCFLYVAMHPDATVSEIAEAGGIQRPTASRILLELGSRSRGIGSGYGLIEADRTNEDLRVVSQRLTAEGRKLMARVVKVMEA